MAYTYVDPVTGVPLVPITSLGPQSVTYIDNEDDGLGLAGGLLGGLAVGTLLGSSIGGGWGYPRGYGSPRGYPRGYGSPRYGRGYGSPRMRSPGRRGRYRGYSGSYASQHDRPHITKPGMLSPRDEKYCRCVVEVAARGGVRSPYAICQSSVRPGHRPDCWEAYDYQTWTDKQLEGYAKLRKFSGPYDRSSILSLIAAENERKGTGL